MHPHSQIRFLNSDLERRAPQVSSSKVTSSCYLGMRNLSPVASSRLACAPCPRGIEGRGEDTNLGSILKVRELSLALLYHTLLDPVLPESGDDIRHPSHPLLSFGNFRTHSAASGPASAPSGASVTSEAAPCWLRADAKRGVNVATDGD